MVHQQACLSLFISSKIDEIVIQIHDFISFQKPEMIQIQEKCLIATSNLKTSNFEPSLLDLDGSAEERYDFYFFLSVSPQPFCIPLRGI